MSDQTINVPSLFLVVLIASLAIRYFFFSPRSPSSAPPSRRIDPAHIDQISSMFPQVDRRAIQWDLQRNGGSVTATTERILSRGSLDTVKSPFCSICYTSSFAEILQAMVINADALMFTASPFIPTTITYYVCSYAASCTATTSAARSYHKI